MDYQLDLREYRCPLPLLMSKKALKSLQQGDFLTIWINQFSSISDFRLLAKEMNLEIEIRQVDDDVQLVFNKKDA